MKKGLIFLLAALAAFSCTVWDGDSPKDIENYLKSESSMMVSTFIYMPVVVLNELLEADRYIQASETEREDTSFAGIRDLIEFKEEGDFVFRGFGNVDVDGNSLKEPGACWTLQMDYEFMLTEGPVAVRCVEAGRLWSVTVGQEEPVSLQLEEAGRYRVSAVGVRRTLDGYDCSYRTTEAFLAGPGEEDRSMTGVFFHSISRDGKELDWCEAVYRQDGSVDYRTSR